MRILVLIHEYPPIGGGGGRVAQDLCQGLARRGHELRVLTAHFGDLSMEENQAGVVVQRLVSGRREPFRADLRAMMGYIWRAFWEGRKVIRRWKPDLIHVHFAVPAGPVAWALARSSGLRYVLTAHLGDVPGGVPEKTGRWFRWIFPLTPPIWRGAAAVVAVSEYTRSLAIQHYPLPVQVIPNGVDLELLDPGEIQVHHSPQVVFAGRFVPQKNPLQVVQSLSGLRHLPWHCAMVGDGPLRPAVEAEIARLGLAERFTLPGWLEPDQVIEWFQQSDILVMPSRSEGLPVVGVQALAMGLALVLNQVGGCIDLVVPGENGFLIPVEDSQAFEQALGKLLGDAGLLLASRQASRRLASRFDLRAVVESYEALFTQVGAGQHNP